MRRVLFVIALFLVIACEGAEGPMGPTGPQGPPGLSGPGTRLFFTGLITAQGVTVALPAAAGTMVNPPLVACYYSDFTGGAWAVIADGAGTLGVPGCGLRQGASTLEVRIINMPAGFQYGIVVVY